MFTSVGHLFRLIVFHAIPEDTTFQEEQPSVLLRTFSTKQWRMTDDCNQWAYRTTSLP
ncbi:hypothetical protein EVA_11629 [gut metagenome]|uniref:Uncharacterized protein n=1 Tax=gut metagenome TaxID=749906 RepID=J9GKQ3_9ZZZZ